MVTYFTCVGIPARRIVYSKPLLISLTLSTRLPVVHALGCRYGPATTLERGISFCEQDLFDSTKDIIIIRPRHGVSIFLVIDVICSETTGQRGVHRQTGRSQLRYYWECFEESVETINMALAVPPGVTPNYYDSPPSSAWQSSVANSVGLAIVTIVVFARCYTKFFIVKAPGWEDCTSWP